MKLITSLALSIGLFLLSASIVWAEPSQTLAATGQTNCYNSFGVVISCDDTGQDGDLQLGVTSPSPRFNDREDGTVFDRLTGLMWAKNANLVSEGSTWQEAIDFANNYTLGAGGCGASFTDWRLPNIRELQSLIDFSNQNPPLPAGHPFLNVLPGNYWSSTTSANLTNNAWLVSMYSADVLDRNKNDDFYVWPVRRGN